MVKNLRGRRHKPDTSGFIKSPEGGQNLSVIPVPDIAADILLGTDGPVVASLDGNNKTDGEVQANRKGLTSFEEVIVEKETMEGVRPQTEQLETDGAPPLRER